MDVCGKGRWIAGEAVAPRRPNSRELPLQLPRPTAKRQMSSPQLQRTRRNSRRKRAQLTDSIPRRRCGISKKAEEQPAVKELVARGGIEPPTRGFSVLDYLHPGSPSIT